MSNLEPIHSPRGSFLQNPRVQAILPFATSLGLHLCLVATGLLVYKTIPLFVAVTQEQIIIPDTNLVENADNGGVKNPGINDDSTRSAQQNLDENVRDSPDWSNKKSDTLNSNLLNGSADVQQNITPIGVGANVGGAISGIDGRGVGESRGNLAPFGPSTGGGSGKNEGMFKLPGGNVKRVIYVSDASGSMLGEQQMLLNSELKRAIDGLRPSQSFNIFFFQRDSYNAIEKGRLLVASQQNKTIAYKFIADCELGATSNPIPALEAALELQPELIFLLTDGILSDPERVKAMIAQKNANKKVAINTILFVNRVVRDEEAQALKDIAAANNGKFKLVRSEDLLK